MSPRRPMTRMGNEGDDKILVGDFTIIDDILLN
jgi:hypothetical protein